jgi:hypothetical protein
MLGGFASLAGNFHAAMIKFDNAIFHAKRGKFIAIGAKRIGFDYVRTRFEVNHVRAENVLGAGGVKFIDAALWSHGFIEQRPHRAIGNENTVA